jgi:integrase/recombinase XerC
MPNDLITAYLDHLRMEERSPRTIEDRREILSRIDHDLPLGLDAATADELRAWIYRDGWSAQTKATYYGAVRGFFVWANDAKDPMLDFDPTDLLVRPKVVQGMPRPATDQQVEVIATRARSPYRLWGLLAAYQGLRCCEVSALDREHIAEDFTLVHGKGAKQRYVPTDPAVWAIVRDFPAGPIATGRAGRCSAYCITDRAATHFQEDLGVRTTMHPLRHWYATRTLALCGDLRKVQVLLGHSTPNSTAIYTLVTPEQLREAVRGLPRFGAAAGAGAETGEAAR